MPMNLTTEQVTALISSMQTVTEKYMYGVRTKAAAHQLDYQNKTRARKGESPFEDICNCWEAIIFAAKNANLGHTTKDIDNSSKSVYGAVPAIAVYMMNNRRFIMFGDSGRKQYGIPSGLTKPGDILMYGSGKHIVLNTSEQLAYTESVMEFDRGQNRGLVGLNELEARFGNDLLICAPLPKPGELGEIYDHKTRADLSMFSAEKQAIPEMRRFLGDGEG